MRDEGYTAACLKILQPRLTAKSDMLVGACGAARPQWAAAVAELAALPASALIASGVDGAGD